MSQEADVTEDTHLNDRNTQSPHSDGSSPRLPERAVFRPETSITLVESGSLEDTPPRLSLNNICLDTFSLSSLSDDKSSKERSVDENGSPSSSPSSSNLYASSIWTTPTGSSTDSAASVTPSKFRYTSRGNPKASRVRPSYSAAAALDGTTLPAIFTDRIARTPSGSGLYRLSHAMPSLLANYEYIAGLEALQNVTPPMPTVPDMYADGDGNDTNGLSIHTLHPRDRALLHVLMYAELPPDLTTATAAPWLTPFTIHHSKLLVWKATTPPEQTTLNLRIFTTLLRSQQRGYDADINILDLPPATSTTPNTNESENEQPGILSRLTHVNDMLSARGITPHTLPFSLRRDLATAKNDALLNRKITKYMQTITSDVFEHRVRLDDEDPKSMYAYRFSHAVPMGEVFRGCGYDAGYDFERLEEGEGGLEEGAKRRGLGDMVREGRKKYGKSRVGVGCKVLFAILVGGAVVGFLIWGCFFHFGRRERGRGYD